MRQSKVVSLLEVCVNVATGFVIALGVWMFVIPLVYPRMESTAGEGFLITTIFTVTSVARGYLWRRFFNNGVHNTLVDWVSTLWWRRSKKLECEEVHLACALGNKPCPVCGCDVWCGPVD